MSLRSMIANILAHLTPTTLTKHITPEHKSVLDFSGQCFQDKPWIDTHLVEVTAEDFA